MKCLDAEWSNQLLPVALQLPGTDAHARPIYLYFLYNKTAFQLKVDHPWIHTFCSCDLGLDLMTFTNQPDLYPMQIYLHTKNELSGPRLSTVIILRHTDRCDQKHYHAASWVVIINNMMQTNQLKYTQELYCINVWSRRLYTAAKQNTYSVGIVLVIRHQLTVA